MEVPDVCQNTTDIIHLAWWEKQPYPITHLAWAVLSTINYLEQESVVEVISPQGHNRMAAFLACLLIAAEDLPASEAINRVRKDYCPHCLTDAEGQAALLAVVDLFSAHSIDGSLYTLFDWDAPDAGEVKPVTPVACNATVARPTVEQNKGVAIPTEQQLLLATP